MQKTKRKIKIFIAFLTMAAALFLSGKDKLQELIREEPAAAHEPGRLEVHYIDVGQGDATLIICDGEAMLIDAGNNNKGTLVQKYLMDQGVKELKYAIATHPDADHIGGMDVILYKFPTERVLLPDINHDTRTYEDMMDTIRQQRIDTIHPQQGDTYALGSARFTVLAPKDVYSGNNDNSIVIRLVNGDNGFLFTGDAEENSIEDILAAKTDIQSDVYKVGHHGSTTATTEELLWEVQPRYAVISSGADNPYEHPHDTVTQMLKKSGIEIFRTDMQGSIKASSDGTTITWTTER